LQKYDVPFRGVAGVEFVQTM
jgi:hypothetical protein